MSTDPARIVVVGAGLAGLIAAAELARAGTRVTVLDGAGHPGGRAHTTVDDGVRRNLGPHAVFRSGELAATLRRLGVPVAGRAPNLAAARVRMGPDTLGGIALGRLLRPLPRLLRHVPEPGTSVTEWLDGTRLEGRERSLVQTMIRTATYAHAPDVQDAVAAHQQLRRSVGGVVYVHHGWGTLVDALVRVVADAGGEVHRSRAVRRVHLADDVVAGVELDDGRDLPADGVVLAVGSARDDLPVRVATLDLALDAAPRTDRRSRVPAQLFGGGDDPRYWLVQSRYARLVPDDGEVVHVTRYLAPGERGDARTRDDLEAWADEVAPGWRARVRHARSLMNMTVAHVLPLAATGGLAGRVPVRTPVTGDGCSRSPTGCSARSPTPRTWSRTSPRCGPGPTGEPSTIRRRGS
ncbi:FAD-dependent oxidoreductase [Nitriliruptoraceae bacterium ZYF776]|nr:FAD-dependent oxidoreductase [Profundirhabdus halotolerans]